MLLFFVVFFFLQQCFSNLLKHFKSVLLKSTCNAGDPSSSPGSGRSAGGGIGYPLQYSWASLVAQLVKNPPAMWETWVLSLGWEDPLEKGMATHSSILAWRTPWTVESMGSQRVRHDSCVSFRCTVKWFSYTYTCIYCFHFKNCFLML